MTHDFRIVPPHYGILRFDRSDIIDRLTELENDRRDVTIFVQKFPDIEKCCKNLNLKFDAILKEFKLIKNRVEELAETAHEALDKSEAMEEKIKILVDVKPDHLKDLDSRVTELAKRFVVVKTVTEQNREICTAVQDQVGNLKTNVIKPIVKAEVDKEATDLKDELDHIKSLIEDDLETFKKEIEDKLKNKPGGATTPDLTKIKAELEEYINDRLNQPGGSAPDVTKLLNIFKKEINAKITKLTTRINEVADVANSNLTKIDKIIESKPTGDNGDDLKSLIEDLKIVKTTTIQNREICTAVKTKADKLEGDLTAAKKDLESSIEETEASLLTKIEEVKALIKNSKPVDSKELEKLKTRINEIADVAHEAGKCCDKIDDLKKKFEDEVNKIKQDAAARDTKIKTVDEEVSKIKQDAVARDEKIKDVEIKCDEEVKDLKEKAAARDKRLTDAVTEIKKLEGDAIARDKKLDTVKAKCEADVNKLSAEGKARDAKLKEIKTDCEAEIENLKTAATVRDKEIEELRGVETELKNDITKLKDEGAACDVELQAVKTKCETDVKRLEENGKIRDDEIDKLTDAKAACEAAVKELKDSVQSQIDKTKKLTSEAADRDVKIKDLEDSKTRCDEAIKTLTKADSDLKSALDALTKRHDVDFKKVEKEAVDVKNKIEAELKTLKTRLGDEANKIGELETARDVAVRERRAASALIERTRSELNEAVNKHELLNVTVQGHSDRFAALDQNFKTLETLTETRHEKLRAAINALDKSLTSEITKVAEGAERDVNDLKKSIADQTKALTDLKTAQDKLKTDLYKKLKVDYDELREAIDKTSGLTVDAVKEALDWTDLINRVEFLENEVNVNVKTRFVNLENSLNELQGVASDAHDLATLLQQMLKNVPDKIKALEEKTDDLKTSS